MIGENYVSFETAKLLKEKGFDEKCVDAYISQKARFEAEDNDCYYNPPYINHEFDDWYEKDCCTKPTLQMAMKWLREKGFHIFVPLEIDCDEDDMGNKWYHDASYYPEIRRVCDGKIMYDDGSLYEEPEQAAEVAIKYCLENLL